MRVAISFTDKMIPAESIITTASVDAFKIKAKFENDCDIFVVCLACALSNRSMDAAHLALETTALQQLVVVLKNVRG